MHKNMYYKNLIIDIFAVTFRKEGVDWNAITDNATQNRAWSPSARKVWIEIDGHVNKRQEPPVTFRKEGVDWNCVKQAARVGIKSPSARKVWIEMKISKKPLWWYPVTFRKEGVDWNQ